MDGVCCRGKNITIKKHFLMILFKSDPDLVIGYNMINFDFPYILDRVSALGIQGVPSLGRIRGFFKYFLLNLFFLASKTNSKDTRFSSKAYGTRDNKTINLDGRLQMDLLAVMQRDYKLRSYTLNSVCAHFLGKKMIVFYNNFVK